MSLNLRIILLQVICCVSLAYNCYAIDLFFQPDTTFGNVGDTIQLSARIGASDTLRAFTVYLVYDTNQIDLATAPIPGSLIASRQGLDFRYSDHSGAAPYRLEIGATVFSTDYWAGPGEVFVARFVLRACVDPVISAEVGFRRPNSTFIAGNYIPPLIYICGRVPQSISTLTITQSPIGMFALRWQAVRLDTLGRQLLSIPQYDIFREQVWPSTISPSFIISVTDTFYSDTIDANGEYLFHVVVRTN
jgi:hypothetical protein